MAKATCRKFYYRVTLTTKTGKTGTFLAEVAANLDETARRTVIEKEASAGSRVRKVMPTQDLKPSEGEWYKRCYP
jgi:hypothetical protein